MIFQLNNKLMTTMFVDNTVDNMAAILLENILLAMEDECFSKDLSAKIVGGEGKLNRLIESGLIRFEKPTNKQNGKWFCKASDVLRHCARRRRNRKKKVFKK